MAVDKGAAPAERRLSEATIALLAGRHVDQLDLETAEQLIGGGAAGVLLRAVDGGAVSVQQEVKALLAMASLDADMSRVSFAEPVSEVVATLHRFGVRPRVMKGAANALTLYEQPAYRNVADVDFVIGLDQEGDLARALASLGFSELQLDSIARLRRANREIGGFSASRSTHRAVADFHFNPFGLLLPVRDGGSLVDKFVEVRSPWGVVETPQPSLALAIALVHFVRDGGLNFKPVCDVVRLIGLPEGDLDWSAFAAVLKRERIEGMCWTTLRSILDDLCIDAPEVAHLCEQVNEVTVPSLLRPDRRGSVEALATLKMDLPLHVKYTAVARWYAASRPHLILANHVPHGGSYLNQWIRLQAKRLSAVRDRVRR